MQWYVPDTSYVACVLGLAKISSAFCCQRLHLMIDLKETIYLIITLLLKSIVSLLLKFPSYFKILPYACPSHLDYQTFDDKYRIERGFRNELVRHLKIPAPPGRAPPAHAQTG